MTLTAKKLGQRLQRTRVTSHLSQRDVAKALEISWTAIRRMEAGDRPINTLQLEKFARLCGTEVADLFASRRQKGGAPAVRPIAKALNAYHRDLISRQKLEELLAPRRTNGKS